MSKSKNRLYEIRCFHSNGRPAVEPVRIKAPNETVVLDMAEKACGRIFQARAIGMRIDVYEI